MDADSNLVFSAATQEAAATASVVSVPAPGAAESAHPQEIQLDLSGPIMVLMWICFAVMLLILHRLTWKPVMKLVSQRENAIKKALDDAEKARKELAEIEERGRKTLADVQAESRHILEAARAESERSATAILEKARKGADEMAAGARAEIVSETEKARETLRADSAALAIELAGRLMRENMDSARNRKLVEDYSKRL